MGEPRTVGDLTVGQRQFLEIVRRTREYMHGTPAQQQRALDYLESLREYGGQLAALADRLEAYALLPPERMRH